MPTKIDFEGELKLLERDEELDIDNEPPHKRWARFLPQDEAQEANYTGMERRRGARREGRDRREMVRFETKSDRRSGKDRRKGAWSIKYTV